MNNRIKKEKRSKNGEQRVANGIEMTLKRTREADRR